MGRPRKTPAEKLKTLPLRYRANLFSWNLDWRTPVAQRLASEVLLIAQTYGGWEFLTRPKQILVERAAHLACQVAEWETAERLGTALPFDHGTYSNKANVLSGLISKLGLERIARPVGDLQEHLRGAK